MLTDAIRGRVEFVGLEFGLVETGPAPVSRHVEIARIADASGSAWSNGVVGFAALPQTLT